MSMGPADLTHLLSDTNGYSAHTMLIPMYRNNISTQTFVRKKWCHGNFLLMHTAAATSIIALNSMRSQILPSAAFWAPTPNHRPMGREPTIRNQHVGNHNAAETEALSLRSTRNSAITKQAHNAKAINGGISGRVDQWRAQFLICVRRGRSLRARSSSELIKRCVHDSRGSQDFTVRNRQGSAFG